MPPKKEEGDWIVGAILGGLAGVLFLMAAIFGTVGWVFAARAQAAMSWPTTEGVVVTHEVLDYQALRNGRWETQKRINFEYTYEVAGQSYTGTRYHFTGSGRALTDYEPLGAPVTVHYNPADPAEAGLNVEPLRENPWWYVVTAFLSLLGSVFAFFGVRSWLRWRAAMRAPAQAP